MRRIIKFNYIGEKVSSVKKMLIELEEAKNKLKKDVESISSCFTGPDGNLIKNIYLKKLLLINKYIENVKRYAEYYTWLSASYKENYLQSKSKLSSKKSIANDYNDLIGFGNGVNIEHE